jgi:hypothetical protein
LISTSKRLAAIACTVSLLAAGAPVASAHADAAPASAPAGAAASGNPPTKAPPSGKPATNASPVGQTPPGLLFTPPSVGPITVDIGAIIIDGKVMNPELRVSTPGVTAPPISSGA